MAKLVVLTEGFTGTTHDLKIERTTVGRLEDNTFQIPEPSVSGHHCEVCLRGTEVVVKDLGSTNGTFVNGEQVKEQTLKPGQILRLGQVELRLEDPTAAPPKKSLDHTVAITSGVKLGELDHTAHPVGSPFAKKSNKANKIILVGAIVLGAIIIGLILYSIFSASSMG